MERILLLLFSFIVEAIVFGLYSFRLFFSAYSLKRTTLSIALAHSFLFLISLGGINWLNTIAYFGCSILLLTILFKVQTSTALFHSTILTAIMGISELTLLVFMNKYDPSFLTESSMSLFFYTIFSKLFFYIIIYLLTHIFKKNKDTASNPADYFLVAIPAASIFIIFVFLSICKVPYYSGTINILIVIGTILLLGINLLTFGLQQYNQKKNKEFTELQLLLQKETDSVEYYKMLLTQNENQSILIHDIKNHLHSIALLNNENENEKITAYIHQLLHSSDLKEFSKVCDHSMLNAILCRYQRKCSEEQISFYADIRNNTLQQINENDLTTLFGNLLDNALEAAISVLDAFIELTVQRKENASLILITLINSCRNIPIYTPNKKLLTTKSDTKKHGFGMKSIQKIVLKYHGDLETYFDEKTATFHTIITLKI
ncbi:MAG: sensor histidine kinase [Candidatus Fimimorpha sp.]